MPYADPDKQREYQREWMAARRAAWFAGRTCVVCGGDEELELHHHDPVRKVTHRIWSWADERREVELAKCVTMCAPCHNELHAAPLRSGCGTSAAYQRGCRCEQCRAAEAARRRHDRARSRERMAVAA